MLGNVCVGGRGGMRVREVSMEGHMVYNDVDETEKKSQLLKASSQVF